MTQAPQGADLWKEEALDELARAENAFAISPEHQPLDAIYHALRAVTYALLAGPQPARVTQALTFGEPSPGAAP